VDANDLDGENAVTPRRDRVGKRSEDLSIDLSGGDDGLRFLRADLFKF
jgi:hypothetical protein